MNERMDYELRLSTTASGVGYFACIPRRTATFDENLAYLRRCPFDEFMHKHLLEALGGLDTEIAGRILELAEGSDPLVVAMVGEASFSFSELSALRARFQDDRIRTLLPYTPLITLKSSLLRDQKLHTAWIRLFQANLSEHRPLPVPESTGLPLLFPEKNLPAALHVDLPIRTVYEKCTQNAGEALRPMPSAEETARRALEKLGEVHAFASDEMRHTSSLSPYGFLRKWHLHLEVRNGRHDYSVTGIQTSYGKGLTEDAARASYAMEMVERISSFAGFGPEGVSTTRQEYPLLHATFTQLCERGTHVLDPNDLRLEAPYQNEPLYWLEARERNESGLVPKWIPAQSVFLFCNLDEVSLFSGLGSTGLASGNTMEQAKVNALLEVIERDCEATTVYDPSRCFRLETRDPRVAPLLGELVTRGVSLQFQDLTGPMGVPCYKCFVVDPRGPIVKGTAAHLSAGKALLSALTETPYAFAQAPVSDSFPDGLPVMRFEELPDYGTGDPSRDLEILETLLSANGFRPLYVDLTREDLGIPVVKALVPGLELMADFDRFSRVSSRLFANYLRTVGRL